jgi:hypothetical protein
VQTCGGAAGEAYDPDEQVALPAVGNSADGDGRVGDTRAGQLEGPDVAAREDDERDLAPSRSLEPGGGEDARHA